jgi:acetyl esterase/lipase
VAEQRHHLFRVILIDFDQLIGGMPMPSKEFETILQLLKSRPIEEDLPFDQLRANFEAQTAIFKVAEDVRVEPVTAGKRPAEWIIPPGSQEDRNILYLHGGGYVIGSIKTHREMVSRIARESKARALLVDYRLAPEHPFPAAVEDAGSAYLWLIDQGVDPRRTIIAGDSAGGGLTAATLVFLRDRGAPLPAAAVCLSPWADLEGSGNSMITRANIDPMVNRQGLVRMAGAYLGGKNPRTPLASPIYADLKGLPPLLIQVGTAEVLFDDAVRLAERARADGVEVVLEPWEDMVHVWHFFASMLPEGQEAIERIAEFIQKKTG